MQNKMMGIDEMVAGGSIIFSGLVNEIGIVLGLI